MDTRVFDEGLGEKLRAPGGAPKTHGKRALIPVSVALALVVATVFLATQIWIGTEK